MRADDAAASQTAAAHEATHAANTTNAAADPSFTTAASKPATNSVAGSLSHAVVIFHQHKVGLDRTYIFILQQ